MQDWLIHLVTDYPVLVYGVILLIGIVEGPILSLACGFLMRLGYFYFLPLYAALILSDLIGDVIWYYVGRNFGRKFSLRFGRYFGVTEKNLEKTSAIFHKHSYNILFISKITNGFGLSLATLITAGMVKVPFSKYVALNLAGQFIWSGFLLGTGYFLGEGYVSVDKALLKISIGAVALIGFWLMLRLRQTLGSKLENE